MSEFVSRESRIQAFRLRPRFKIETNSSEQKVIEGIKKELEQKQGAMIGSFLPSYLYIRYPKAKRKYWTPQLQVSIDTEPEKQTSLRCLIGPHPEVWTFFVFLYSFSAFMIMVGLIYGLSQISLDKDPTGFWFLLPAVLVLNLIFIASKLGQRKGKQHKMDLLEFMLNVVDDID